MSSFNYYLLSFLPAVGELGSVPPISLSELVALLYRADNAVAVSLVKALTLGDDLRQREAYLCGEREGLEFSILTTAQGRGEAPLPEYILDEREVDRRHIEVDNTWAAYFCYAKRVSEWHSSPFLEAWVTWEVSLRNALVEARAKALQLDVGAYQVSPHLGEKEADFEDIVSDWSQAKTPFEGFKVLERARWCWLAENDSWFSFSDDELASYGAKLISLKRWRRVHDVRKEKGELYAEVA